MLIEPDFAGARVRHREGGVLLLVVRPYVSSFDEKKETMSGKRRDER